MTEPKTSPGQAKDFVKSLMTKSERDQGRLPQERRNDELAQELLEQADKRESSAPKQVESKPKTTTEDLGYSDMSSADIERLKALDRKQIRAVFEHQDLYLRVKRLRETRRLYPDLRPHFEKMAEWLRAYPLMHGNTPEAKHRGQIEANKITDWLLNESARRFGYPYYYIKRDGKLIDPYKLMEFYPANDNGE